MAELLIVATLLAVAALYARGWRVRDDHAIPRAFAFYAALALVFVALSSPVETLAEELFLVHMVQHLVLVMVAAPLLLLGAPLGPVLRGLPRGLRDLVQPALARGGLLRAVADIATQPLVALATYVAVLSVWHLPALYDAALASEALHVAEHATFVLAALLFWAQVIDPLPFKAPLPYPLRIVYLFVATAHNTVLGGILSFAEPTLYAWYAARPERFWGIAPAADQQWGGVIMWVPGGMVHLIAISVVFALWLAAEDRSAVSSRRPGDPSTGELPGSASRASPGLARDARAK